MKGHTSFKLKKRLFVIKNDGTKFVDRLLEQHSTYYVFAEAGKVPVKDIRSASYKR